MESDWVWGLAILTQLKLLSTEWWVLKCEWVLRKRDRKTNRLSQNKLGTQKLRSTNTMALLLLLLPLSVSATSFKMDFLSAGTVRTDALQYINIGDCLRWSWSIITVKGVNEVSRKTLAKWVFKYGELTWNWMLVHKDHHWEVARRIFCHSTPLNIVKILWQL